MRSTRGDMEREHVQQTERRRQGQSDEPNEGGPHFAPTVTGNRADHSESTSGRAC